jgi:hypothetical protein
MFMKNPRSILVFLFVTLLSAAPAFAQPRFDPPGLERALAAQAQHTDNLLQISGIAGTAVGVGADGNAVVKIYAEKGGIGGLPQDLDGVPVEVQVTGKILALAGKPGGGGGGGGGGVNPQGTFTQPVPLGVSSGSVASIQPMGIFITCTSGTLGARLHDGSNYYALSNNHVYDNTNSGKVGDQIQQPGPADTGCVANSNVIGTLAKSVPIDFSTGNNNTVDASIALSSPGQLGNKYWDNTTQSTSPVTAALNTAVEKYGAVSKLTTGKVVAINATLNVDYGNGQIATFTGQIEYSGCKGACIKSGDSGSVLITNNSAHNPVGLLFAGDQTGKFAWANPISDVLSQLGALLGKTLVFQ